MYDWLVANYLKNGGDFPMDETTSTTTYGALDLGGASTQISFPVMRNSALSNESSSSSTFDESPRNGRNVRLGRPTTAVALEEDHNYPLPLLPLRIDNVEYPLYTQSFLYYGVDQARIRYDAEIIASSSSDSDNTKLRTNPCYPAGYTDPNSHVSGTSNWEECLHSVAEFFVEQTPNCSNDKGAGGDKHNHRCLLDNSHGVHDDERQQHQQQPPIDIDLSDRKFIAMSAFVYTWDYLNLQIGEDTDDLEALNTSASRVCDMTHEEQMTRHHKLSMENNRDRDRTSPATWKTDKPHAQCFNAAFTYHLLSRGYGLPIKRTPIEIYHDINGTKVQWALGLMLVEANKGGGSIFVGDDDDGTWQRQLQQTQQLQPLLQQQLPRQQQQQHRQLDIIGVGNTYKYLFAISTLVLVVLTWIFGRLPCFFRLKRVSAEESCLPLVDPNATMQNLTPRKGR